MSTNLLPKYVFRGTTINYSGNPNSINVPYTSTSTHPVRALWFALECYQTHPDTSVVYVAKTDKLSGLEFGFNLLCDIEDEVSFFIQPTIFYPLCEGYVFISDFQHILKDFDIDANQSITKENLNRVLK